MIDWKLFIFFCGFENWENGEKAKMNFAIVGVDNIHFVFDHPKIPKKNKWINLKVRKNWIRDRRSRWCFFVGILLISCVIFTSVRSVTLYRKIAYTIGEREQFLFFKNRKNEIIILLHVCTRIDAKNTGMKTTDQMHKKTASISKHFTL